MAYQKGPEEHPSRTIVKTMKAGSQTGIFPRLILLCGKEEFLIEWSKNFLKEGLLNPACMALDCASFSEDEINAQEIINACDTMPLFSTKKLVIVEDSDILTSNQPKDMPSSDAEMLCNYLSKIPETTMLVFTCSKPNKTKAIYKAIAKQGIVYDFTPLDDATLGGWIGKRFAAAGKNASKKDMVDFAKICGYGDIERNYNLFNLENDLKKIFALYDKTDISLEDMLSAASVSGELNAFKLLDAAFSGNKGKALEILHSSIDAQTASKEMGVVLSFLGLLISQLEIMLEGRERLEEGQSSYEAISAMGVNEYRFKKAMSAVSGKNSKQLQQSLYNAIQIEKDLKTGNMEGRTALELFIGNL